jgi:hypothetical protein
MNADCLVPDSDECTRRGATILPLSWALAWFLACVGLSVAASLFSPAAKPFAQSSAVNPVAFTTSR